MLLARVGTSPPPWTRMTLPSFLRASCLAENHSRGTSICASPCLSSAGHVRVVFEKGLIPAAPLPFPCGTAPCHS